MAINATSMNGALTSLDYASLYQAQGSGQSATSGIPQEILNLARPATVSLDASSASPTADALQQVSKPATVSLDADSLQALSNYAANQSSLDATNQVQGGASLLARLFGN